MFQLFFASMFSTFYNPASPLLITARRLELFDFRQDNIYLRAILPGGPFVIDGSFIRMKNQVVKNSIAAFMLTAASLLLGGGSDQQSLDWLAKIKDVYAKGALSVDMDVNLSV